MNTITLPITGKKIRFILISSNTISYSLNKRITSIAQISDNEKQLNWDNGTVWIRTSNANNNKNNINHNVHNDGL